MSLRLPQVACFAERRLGVDYYCFHDVDVAPQGQSLQEKWAGKGKQGEVNISPALTGIHPTNLKISGVPGQLGHDLREAPCLHFATNRSVCEAASLCWALRLLQKQKETGVKLLWVRTFLQLVSAGPVCSRSALSAGTLLRPRRTSSRTRLGPRCSIRCRPKKKPPF